MNYMPAIGAHNKGRTATKRVFCRDTKTTHPKRGIPPGKTCILTKTYFLPHIPADDYGRYLYLFRFKRDMSRSVPQLSNSY